MFLLPNQPQQLIVLFNLCTPNLLSNYLNYNNNIIQFIIYRIVTPQVTNRSTITITKQLNGIEFDFATIDIILFTHSFILLSI